MTAKNIVVIDSDLEEIAPAFIEKRKSELGSIADAIAQQDFESLRTFGHKIKGNAGGYGFDELSDYGAELERAALQKNLPALQAAYSLIRSYLSDLEIRFKKADGHKI